MSNEASQWKEQQSLHPCPPHKYTFNYESPQGSALPLCCSYISFLISGIHVFIRSFLFFLSLLSHPVYYWDRDNRKNKQSEISLTVAVILFLITWKLGGFQHFAELFILFLKTFFLMWTIFKVFIKSVTMLLLFYVFWLQSTWDVSSSTRNWTHAPWIGSKILTTGPLGKS